MTTSSRVDGKPEGETPAEGEAGECPQLCPEQVSEAEQPLPWQAPSHCPPSPFPVGWCLCGGEGPGELCLPVQVCEGGMPSPESWAPPPPSPAGIKLVLTWDPVSFIAAPTFPTPLPPRREQLRGARTKSLFDWRVQNSGGVMWDLGLHALPTRLRAAA